MIDSHAHLFDEKFDDDIDATIARAVAAGVDKFILPATMPDEFDRLFKLAALRPDIFFASMGLHPLSMNENPRWRDDLQLVSDYLKNPPVKFYAIGEVGLDLHWDTRFLNEQKEAFVAQIELAMQYDLPLIIHLRDAWEHIFDILAPYKGKIRGVFHSFAGGRDEVKKVNAIGNFVYGINGTVTYKKSSVADALQDIELSQILLETDAPYLPPSGHRGERNEPAYVPIIAATVAQIKGVSIDELDRITTTNTLSFVACDPLEL